MNRANLLLLSLLLLLAALPAATASAAAPREFFGVMADGPALDPATDLAAETKVMRSTGVGSLRVAFYWRSMNPQPFAPIDFSETDRIVGAAARNGLRVLPAIVRAPSWATGGDEREGAVPDADDYARFVGQVVRRYGRGGSFWAANPSLPRKQILAWQVWNEPDITRYWVAKPWPSTYVKLLRPARAAIKEADPKAKVVLAGLTNKSWVDLDKLYRAGARKLFDVAALHPFSKRVGNVLKIVRRGRATMRKRGDARKPVILSEISWTSAKGEDVTLKYGWETTERGQAQKVRDVIAQLAKERRRLRISAFYWFTWLSPQTGKDESFAYSGLRKLNAAGRPVAKPAQGAFRAAVRRARR